MKKFLKLNFDTYYIPKAPYQCPKEFSKNYISAKDVERFQRYVQKNRSDEGLIDLISQSKKRFDNQAYLLIKLYADFEESKIAVIKAKTGQEKDEAEKIKKIRFAILSAASRESDVFALEDNTLRYKGMLDVVVYDETKAVPEIQECYMCNQMYEVVNWTKKT